MSPIHNPLVIVWRITEACDLGCHFCAYSRHLRRRRVSADPKQVLAFGKLLGEYAKTYTRDILVSWLGGEPLLWPSIWEISQAFKYDFGLRLSATTNGTALASAKAREQVVELFDELTISVDGINATHDRLRDAPGLFSQLQASVSELHRHQLQLKRGPRLRANTILMRDTIYDFPQLCERLAEWGVTEFTFNALGGRDRPEFFPDHCLLPEHIEWLRREMPALREAMSVRGLVILGNDIYLNRLMASASNYQLPITNCSPGQHFLFIDEHGFIAPCSYTTQGYGLPLSELCSAVDLYQLPDRLARRQQQQLLAPCYDCPSTQVFGKFDHDHPRFCPRPQGTKSTELPNDSIAQ